MSEFLLKEIEKYAGMAGSLEFERDILLKALKRLSGACQAREEMEAALSEAEGSIAIVEKGR